MEAKKLHGFFFAALVTGLCFLSFDIFFKIVDGENSKFFLWTYRIAFISCLLAGFFILIHKKQNSDQNSEA